MIPKPRDSDEKSVVELNEEGEALNIESVTERLATDLKVAEDEEEEEEEEKTDYDGEGMAKYAEAKTHEWRDLLEQHTHGIGERWEMWTSKSGREDDC